MSQMHMREKMRGEGAIAGGGCVLRKLSRSRKAEEHGLLLIYQRVKMNFLKQIGVRLENIKCGDKRG